MTQLNPPTPPLISTVGATHFASHLHDVCGLADQTTGIYLRDAELFLQSLREILGRDPSASDLTISSVRGFIDRSRGSGAAPPTLARRLVAIRTLLKYAAAVNLIAADPTKASDFPFVTVTPKALGYLSSAVIDRLLSIPYSRSFQGTRDRTVLEILCSSGIMTSEAIGLNIQDIDCGKACIRTGVPTRAIPISSRALQAVRDYLPQRATLVEATNDQSAFFLNRFKQRLGPRSLRKIVAGASRRAGITGEVSPTVLRHSHAISLLNAGTPVTVVQERLGMRHRGSMDRICRAATAVLPLS